VEAPFPDFVEAAQLGMSPERQGHANDAGAGRPGDGAGVGAQTVTIPKYEALMWPTLQAIKSAGGSATIQEIVEKVVEILGLTEEQQQVSHKQGPETELEYRLAWARTYLKGVGALDNSQRGIWSVTDKGRALAEQDIASIPSQFRALSKAGGLPWQGDNDRPGSMQEPTRPEAAFPKWKERLLEVLRAVPPDRFERLAQRLLREAGFLSVTVTGRSGDLGIDGTGIYRLSLLSFPVFFQCKRYRASVSVAPGDVRDFRGAMAGRGDKGLFITTSSFTAEAKREATRPGVPPIDLIDGDRLCDLLKEYALGIETRQEVSVEAAFFQGI
jgi:restriction system protein